LTIVNMTAKFAATVQVMGGIPVGVVGGCTVVVRLSRYEIDQGLARMSARFEDVHVIPGVAK